MHPSRRGSRWVAAAILFVTFTSALSHARPAFAHAIVESTEPAIDETVDVSPERVVMRFNEPVEVSFGGIRVFDTTGDRVDQGETDHLPDRADEIAVDLQPDLADGTYTVAWRVVSADGHPISEAFVFHVGAPGAHPEGIASRVLNGDDATKVAVGIFTGVRWLNFLALLVLAGGAIFLAAVWTRVEETSTQRAATEFSRRLGQMLVVAWWVLVVTTFASLVLQGAVAGGLPLGRAASPAVIRQVLETRFGIVALAKLGLLLVAAVFWRLSGRPVLAVLRPQSAGAAAAHAPDRGSLVTGVLLAVGLLATPGLAGHAGTTSPVALNLGSDILHLVAAATWIGGLIVLVGAAFPAVKSLSEPEKVKVLAPVVARFSDLAMIAVAVIVVTGTYRTWTEVGAWRAFTAAPYGWVLLAKLGVFLPLLALGAINNRWTKPRMERASDPGGDRAGHALGLLKRLVSVEVVLAVVVLGLTAFLVNLPPARVAAGVTGPF
ncbi:MAG: copper transport protein, partial [Actinomycetota bacterium]|nr:copper transport protein [Actinomycetota bacterium]